MAEKIKSPVKRVTETIQDAAAAVIKAADEHVVQPVGKALGLTGDTKKDEGAQPVATEATKPAPAKHAAAVRMMTKSVAMKKPRASKGKSQRVADAAKPSQTPAAGSAARGPRRGASKGR